MDGLTWRSVELTAEDIAEIEAQVSVSCQVNWLLKVSNVAVLYWPYVILCIISYSRIMYITGCKRNIRIYRIAEEACPQCAQKRHAHSARRRGMPTVRADEACPLCAL